jgi:hypothetical protein
MRSVALVCLLICSLCRAATTRNITVAVSFEKPHSAVSVGALQHQLKALLEPAGISVNVMLRSDLPEAPQFSELVVFDMRGSCSMSARPSALDERGPLGMAYESNGHVLHFGEVRCDRVRRCLERITGGAHPEEHQEEYRAALGIVVAHELYHMLADAKAHTKDGLTKESLSARELLEGAVSIPSLAREALRRP